MELSEYKIFAENNFEEGYTSIHKKIVKNVTSILTETSGDIVIKFSSNEEDEYFKFNIFDEITSKEIYISLNEVKRKMKQYSNEKNIDIVKKIIDFINFETNFIVIKYDSSKTNSKEYVIKFLPSKSSNIIKKIEHELFWCNKYRNKIRIKLREYLQDGKVIFSMSASDTSFFYRLYNKDFESARNLKQKEVEELLIEIVGIPKFINIENYSDGDYLSFYFEVELYDDKGLRKGLKKIRNEF